MTRLDTYTALNGADQTMHSLAQLAALTGMQWLPAQPDDSQANLLWNPAQDRLESRAFAVGGHTLRLVVDTNSFVFYFVDQHEQIRAAFPIENRTPTDALIWWQSQLRAWNLTSLKPVSYQLTNEPVQAQTPYKRPDGLPAWAHWRTAANQALTTLSYETKQKSEVRIWPHHFDTGVYYGFPDAAGQERAAIWAGYAIADSLSQTPYFYVSGYVRNQPIDVNTAPLLPVGLWRVTADWQGAIVPISAIEQPGDVDEFLQAAYGWLRRII